MPEMSSISWVALPPEGEVHRIITELVLKNQSQEVVGIITADGRVVELPNLSPHPSANFQVSKADLLKALAGESDLSNLVFWHSHPGGGIGPSRTDMQQKIPYLQHLVVSIVNDDIVYTFY